MFTIKSASAIVLAALCFATSAQAAEQHAVAKFDTCAKPHYPAASLSAKHEGTVTLAFRVDPAGTVLEAKVKKSSGHVPLDTAARDAIKLCKFDPALKDGKAVESWTNMKYVWTLK
jgi:bla regulator protein BlaR1